MHMNDATVSRIKAVSEGTGALKDIIEQYIPLKKSGADYVGVCPKCGKADKFHVNERKSIFKCFSCNEVSGKTAISFLIDTQNMSYEQSLEWLAGHFNVTIERNVIKKRGEDKQSFRDRQLSESGLTSTDTLLNVYEDDQAKTVHKAQAYTSGSIDQFGSIVDGDDMIIHYYDLNRRPIRYKDKKEVLRPFFRVRFKNPAEHTGLDGKPMKYKSPPGSGTHLYIPETIAQRVKNRLAIETLYIQEGEKKSEKACKHGIMSVAISGIHNWGIKGDMPVELQTIVEMCKVKNVVFLMDSDWSDLSHNLKNGDNVASRPQAFASAVNKFKTYFRAYSNMDLYLEIYFAHLTTKSKGIDDVLMLELRNSEDKLLPDFSKALVDREGIGQYVQFHKITNATDHKVSELWKLGDAKTFAEQHKQKLAVLSEFKIQGHKWRFNEQGDFESAQPLETDEQFWILEEIPRRGGEISEKVSFDNDNCYRFLHRRGYGKMLMADGKEQFVHIEDRIVETVNASQIKNFVIEFSKQVVSKNVLNMLFRGGKMYLGPDSLSNLDPLKLDFYKPSENSQSMFFQKTAWVITKEGIVERKINQIDGVVWKQQVKAFEPKLLKENIITLFRMNEATAASMGEHTEIYRQQIGKFFIADMQDSDAAKRCHFFNFLRNTSNFSWAKQEPTFEDGVENLQHLVNKLTTIGYLLHQFFDASNAKAIIGMDGKLSEVGESHGGSGKSIIGNAIGQMLPQVVIPAKSAKLTEDPFIFEEVSEVTDNVFFDDVRANIDFEFLFPYITGNFKVNAKGQRKFTIPKHLTPRIYIATNHAINGEGSSFRRRQSYMAFSDYYNDMHTPMDDFKIRFFDDWDYEQWNLYYNLMAMCLKMYLEHGIVAPPEHDLEIRRLRQTMGETFLQWAEDYFVELEPSDINLPHLGVELERKELYKAFLTEFPKLEKYHTPTIFKRKLKAYCDYKGYIMNPSVYDETGRPKHHDKRGKPILDIKKGSKEYIVISKR